MKILSLIFFMSTLWVSTLKAHELTAEFSGIVNGTIANVSGVVEVSLTGSNLKSGFKTSKYSSFGKVSFVTTHVAASGDQKVIWDNGEFCFTGFVKP